MLFLWKVKGRYGVRFITKDGLIIAYRVSGAASNKTPSDMATVELNFKNYIGEGHPNVNTLKFKFPKLNSGDGGGGSSTSPQMTIEKELDKMIDKEATAPVLQPAFPSSSYRPHKDNIDTKVLLPSYLAILFSLLGISFLGIATSS